SGCDGGCEVRAALVCSGAEDRGLRSDVAGAALKEREEEAAQGGREGAGGERNFEDERGEPDAVVGVWTGGAGEARGECGDEEEDGDLPEGIEKVVERDEFEVRHRLPSSSSRRRV